MGSEVEKIIILTEIDENRCIRLKSKKNSCQFVEFPFLSTMQRAKLSYLQNSEHK